MQNITLANDRFTPEDGLKITVQIPEVKADVLLEAIRTVTNMRYGDYDCVSFQTTPGTQRFRALGTGRNAATSSAVSVPCAELSFFIPAQDALAVRVLKAIYAAHPYEEPVIFVHSVTRTCHISGLDEDNPNRFWNQATADWVPREHR